MLAAGCLFPRLLHRLLLRVVDRVPEVALVPWRAKKWLVHRRVRDAGRRAADRVLHVRERHVVPMPLRLLDLWMELRSGWLLVLTSLVVFVT